MTGFNTTGMWMDGNNLIERKSQDVEPILEYVKDVRQSGLASRPDMKYAAKIPHAIIDQYIAAHPGVTFHDVMRSKSEHMRAILNDPDLSGFRIWQGRV